jgi:hypothetical protein
MVVPHMNRDTDHIIELMDLLRQLLDDLDLAFDPQPGEPETPQSEQQHYAAAVGAVVRFLSKIDPNHASRFRELMNALVDQSKGARPLLLRSLRPKSAPNSTQIEEAKAKVAFALDALIELGDEPQEAANKLLRKFPAIKNLAGAKSHRANSSWAKTLLGWRKELSAPNRRKNEVAAEIFREGRNFTKSLKKSDRRKIEERAFDLAKAAERVGVFVGPSNTL